MKKRINAQKYFTNKSFFMVFITSLAIFCVSNVTYLVEGIFIGQFLSTDFLSIYGVASIFEIIIKIFSSLFTVGLQMVLIKLTSKGQLEKARQVFFTNLVMICALSVIIILFVLIFADQLAFLLGARGEASYLINTTGKYLRILCFCTLPEMLLYVLCPIVQFNSGKRFLVVSSVTILVLAVLGSIINFFVINGGLYGVAFMYVAAEYVGCFVLMTHFLNKNNMFNLRPQKLNFSYFSEIIFKGIPDVAMSICRFVRPISYNLLVLAVSGVLGLASFVVINNLSMFYFSVSSAIGSATLMLTGIYDSENDVSERRNTLGLSLIFVLIFIIPVSFLLVYFAREICCLCSSDLDVVNLTTFAIVCCGLALPIDSLDRIMIKLFQATNHGIMATIMNICEIYVFPILCSMLLCDLIGVDGIWLSFIVVAVLIFILGLILAAINKLTAKKRKAFIDSYTVSDIQIFRKVITNKKDMPIVLDEIFAFLISNHVEKSYSYRILLCTEELLFNIYDDEAMNEKKKVYVGIRIVLDADKAIVRLRDNCNKYDLKKLLNIWTSEDKDIDIDANRVEDTSKGEDVDFCKKTGAKIILETSSDVQYTNTICFNNSMIILPVSYINNAEK